MIRPVFHIRSDQSTMWVENMGELSHRNLCEIILNDIIQKRSVAFADAAEKDPRTALLRRLLQKACSLRFSGFEGTEQLVEQLSFKRARFKNERLQR